MLPFYVVASSRRDVAYVLHNAIVPSTNLCTPQLDGSRDGAASEREEKIKNKKVRLKDRVQKFI